MPYDPFASFEAALPAIIAEHPSQIMRVREVTTDTFRDPAPFTAGPYTVRIEPMKATSAKDIWDEKGSTAVLLFEMIGHNLPAKILQNGALVPLFKLGDQVTDQDDNVYRVAAPQFVRGKFVKLTLELRGS
jgi:hypothetical protein